jgi:hypothetical protein
MRLSPVLVRHFQGFKEINQPAQPFAGGAKRQHGLRDDRLRAKPARSHFWHGAELMGNRAQEACLGG